MKIFFTICLLFGLGKVQVPMPTSTGKDCALFKDIQFKNGIDTMVIKATFKEIAEYPVDMPKSRILLKQKIITKGFNSQVAFQPEKCSKTYYAPLSPSASYEQVKIGEKVYVTCCF